MVVVWICCLSDERELASVFWSLEYPLCSQQWFVCSIRACTVVWYINVISTLHTHLFGLPAALNIC